MHPCKSSAGVLLLGLFCTTQVLKPLTRVKFPKNACKILKYCILKSPWNHFEQFSLRHHYVLGTALAFACTMAEHLPNVPNCCELLTAGECADLMTQSKGLAVKLQFAACNSHGWSRSKRQAHAARSGKGKALWVHKGDEKGPGSMTSIGTVQSKPTLLWIQGIYHLQIQRYRCTTAIANGAVHTFEMLGSSRMLLRASQWVRLLMASRQVSVLVSVPVCSRLIRFIPIQVAIRSKRWSRFSSRLADKAELTRRVVGSSRIKVESRRWGDVAIQCKPTTVVFLI